MGWTPLTVEWAKRALKDMRGVEPKARGQIIAAVEHFASTGEGDLKKLADGSGWRLRVRDYRAFLDIQWSVATVLVTRVSTRGDAY